MSKPDIYEFIVSEERIPLDARALKRERSLLEAKSFDVDAPSQRKRRRGIQSWVVRCRLVKTGKKAQLAWGKKQRNQGGGTRLMLKKDRQEKGLHDLRK